MFDFFKSSTTDLMAEMDKKWFDSLREVKVALDKLQAAEYMPIVTQQDDVTTVTFKGANCTTTITTKTVNLPKVLEQYGLQMPTMATKKKTATKSK